MIYFKSFKTTFNTWKLRELDELEAMRRMTYKWNIISYVENLRKTTTLNTDAGYDLPVWKSNNDFEWEKRFLLMLQKLAKLRPER